MDPNAHPLLPLVWPHSDAPALAAAATRVVDWPALIRQARDEGLVGLLTAKLTAAHPEGVPPDVMAELERLRLVGGQRALRMTGQLLRILALFEEDGIEALPIKGPSLAQDLYGDPLVRRSFDLDILVPFADAPRARRLLLESGFVDVSEYNERVLTRRRRADTEVQLRRAGGEPIVDLHWQMTVALSARRLSAERLLAGARTLTLLERPVRAPSLADQLLLTALHGSRHQWAPLELRLGVAVQVERMPAAAWTEVCAAARDIGCLRRFTVGVVHACAPFGVPVPREIRELFAADPAAPRFLAHLRRSAGSGSARPRDVERRLAAHLSRLWWQMRGEDTLAGTARHLLVRGLRPGHEDWGAVRLPERLLWLHWVLRPIRLTGKYMRARPGATPGGAPPS